MSIRDLEPVIPNLELLRAEANRVAERGRELERNSHPAAIDAATELLRTINCYYSNLIEGHDTHPIAIEEALHGDFSSDPVKRDLQIEATAHIEVQRLIEDKLVAEPATNVCSSDFLRWIHREFHERLPPKMRLVRNPAGNRTEEVVPGELRTFPVRVGQHVAPPHEELPELLSHFSNSYDPARFDRSQTDGLAVLGAAHHRLLWIHPFADGNGRVTRLMTDAFIHRCNIPGHGLWTTSRGLARARDTYKSGLARADDERWNDLDGRGARSARALDEFCQFFLDVCRDQVEYMSDMLDMPNLRERLATYCRLRELGALAEESRPLSRRTVAKGRKPAGWRPPASRILLAAFSQGEIRRKEIAQITGASDRTARRIVSGLVTEGFLASTSHRAPLQARIPAHAAPFILPGLYGPTT